MAATVAAMHDDKPADGVVTPDEGTGGVHVRAALPAEADAIGRLTVAAYRAQLGAGLSDRYAAELGRVDERLAQATVLVAVGDTGALVGAVTYVVPTSPWCEWDDPAAAGLRTLAVDPGVQRRGAATALVRAASRRARADGFTCLVLHCQPEMSAARALYERLGFVRHHHMDWVPVPGIVLHGFRLDLG